MSPQITPEKMGHLLAEIASQAGAIETLCTTQLWSDEDDKAMQLAAWTSIRVMANAIGYMCDHGGANTRTIPGQDRAAPWLLPAVLLDTATQH